MTEAEKQHIFLKRAASVLAERVSQLDVIVQQRIYASLELQRGIDSLLNNDV